MLFKYLRWIVLLTAVAPALGGAQVFTPGNLAILRIGDGTETLVSSGNTLLIDQYTTAGTWMNTVTVPDSGAHALLNSGGSSSEGGLTRSADRGVLVLAGYNTNRGSITGSLSSQSGEAVPRAVATVDAFGAYQLVQASPALYSSNNIRGAASDGTNGFWTAGNPGGTYHLAPPQAPVDLEDAGANTRAAKIIQGRLFFSTQTGTEGIYSFQGGGLPETAVSEVLVVGTGAKSQPCGFALSPTLSTAYIADQRSSAGGIQKWTNNGSVWGLAYSFSTGAGAFDVAVDFSGAVPILYATTAEAGANRLVSIRDSGPLSLVTVLANAGANRIFRGLDFVPNLRPAIVSPPQSQIVTNGSDVTFAVTAQSRSALSYQWQKDGSALIGATTASLTLLGVSSSDQGTYQVVVTNLYGAVTSAAATLAVSNLIAVASISGQPSDQSAGLGGNATFSVTAGGTPPLTFQWQHDGADLAGRTNSSLTIVNAGPADQGAYRARVSNPGGSTNSQAALLTVVSPPDSFVGYTVPGSRYAQNFNSLPNPGLSSVNADNPVKVAGVTYGLANPFDFTFPVLPNSVDPNTGTGLGGLGLTNSVAGWYAAGALGSKFGASAGDQSTGGAISFGSTNSLDASTNRALGLVATSSTGPTVFGLKLINQTTSTLAQITVHVTGELWRQAAVAKSLAASYWIELTGTNGFSTNETAQLSALSVSFPTDATATNPVPVDGGLRANQISLGVTNQAITDWPPGAALWLTWQMTDATGKGQGLAIDDLLFSAAMDQIAPATQLAVQVSGSNVVLSWSAVLTGYQLQSNLDLSQAGGWGPVSQPVIVTNGLNTVTLPIGKTQFFRLKK